MFSTLRDWHPFSWKRHRLALEEVVGAEPSEKEYDDRDTGEYADGDHPQLGPTVTTLV